MAKALSGLQEAAEKAEGELNAKVEEEIARRREILEMRLLAVIVFPPLHSAYPGLGPNHFSGFDGN